VSFKRDQLRYFVTVAEEGQITRAAAKLHIAQPAISHAIAQLESELDLKLLERHARGVTLTSAGEAFLEKARLAVAADTDAAQTAQSLARVQEGTIEFGFLGVPPGLDSPGPLEAFAESHPGIEIRYRELPFPSRPTKSWLSEVDVAACHLPPVDPDIWALPLRRDPRVVLVSTRLPVAGRHNLTVADVVDETFIGLHPSIEPVWVAFWRLDDYRGGLPGRVTVDRASNPQEVLAALAVRRAITTVPNSVASVIASAQNGIAAIPLPDAEPSTVTLVGHKDRRNPLVEALVAFSQEHVEASADDRAAHPFPVPVGAQPWASHRPVYRGRGPLLARHGHGHSQGGRN
jgi:DNA-binding transcriptional LysR family regulator